MISCQISYNEEKNGVELRFPSVPSENIRTTLKAHGWRWSRFSMCWYTRDTPVAREFAEAMAKGVAVSSVVLAKEAPLASPERMRELADGLQNRIDERFAPRLENTHRRVNIAAGIRREGMRLEKLQSALRAIADTVESETLPKSLWKVTNRAQVEDILTGWSRNKKRLASCGLANEAALQRAHKDLVQLLAPNVEREAELEQRRLEASVVGIKIDGFFPTPGHVIDRMLELADVQSGHAVLEPSAGRGDIADRIKPITNGGLKVVEISSTLRKILEAKGYMLDGWDFLEYGERFDRIVMNPPFERFQDVEHVQHAYSLLNDGGRLVSIMGEGVFFRQDRKAVEFREWLERVGGYAEKLPDGSFKSSDRSTGVSCRLVVIDR